MEKTVKTISITVVLAMVMVFGLASMGLAQALPAPVATGTPDSTQGDSFIVNVLKLEVSTDGGTSWSTVWSTGKTLDIALANAGEKAGNFAAGISVPAGTYNAYRITISPSFTIKGVVHLATASGGLNAGWYYTRTTARAGLNPLIASGSGSAASQAAARAAGDFASSLVNPTNTNIVKTGTLDFSVSVGGTAYFQINFDLTGKLGLYALAVINGITYTPYIYPIALEDSDIVITY